MRFTVTADTDIGILKTTNQDSILVKHAVYQGEEILLAVICDGMGGLSKGELASAVVVREFARWCEEDLPCELEQPDMQVIGGKWILMLKELNTRILDYSRRYGLEGVGTTFSGILFLVNWRVMSHHYRDYAVYLLLAYVLTVLISIGLFLLAVYPKSHTLILWLGSKLNYHHKLDDAMQKLKSGAQIIEKSTAELLKDKKKMIVIVLKNLG